MNSNTDCQQIQDQLIDFLYEEEKVSPELKSHFHECVACQKSLEELSQVKNLYQKLPLVDPPYAVSEAIFSRIAKPKLTPFEWIGRLFTHPAPVAIMVFVLTLGGTYLFKRYLPGSLPGTQVAVQEKVSAEAPSIAEMSAPTVTNSYLRMVDWNPGPQLIPDLDRPVLKHTDVTSLEQASIESVCAFKHQIALRHILDGDYAQADQMLDSIIDNYLNYSQWDQAVVQHLQLMKKMGRPQEVKRDIARLKEYAMASPDVIAQAELVAQ
jgi:hypothetical protein